jgi:hypothetical protein
VPSSTVVTRQDGAWEKALSPHLVSTDHRLVKRAGSHVHIAPSPHVGRLSHQVKPHHEATSPRIVSGANHLLAVIKCIYLPLTYLYLIQDIEDRSLLLMSSMSFVDLPLQEHQMTKSTIWTKIRTYLNYVQNQGCSRTI